MTDLWTDAFLMESSVIFDLLIFQTNYRYLAIDLDLAFCKLNIMYSTQNNIMPINNLFIVKNFNVLK